MASRRLNELDSRVDSIYRKKGLFDRRGSQGATTASSSMKSAMKQTVESFCPCFSRGLKYKQRWNGARSFYTCHIPLRGSHVFERTCGAIRSSVAHTVSWAHNIGGWSGHFITRPRDKTCTHALYVNGILLKIVCNRSNMQRHECGSQCAERKLTTAFFGVCYLVRRRVVQ